MDFFAFLRPIEWLVSWVMYLAHEVLGFFNMDPAGGLTWVLTIVFLVIVMRIAMIPLFFKQIRAQRGLQILQPEMKKIQKKYKNRKDPASREAMSREVMALYKEHKTNPFSSCLPILLQSPFFFALFRVLNQLDSIAQGNRGAIGPIDQTVAQQATEASIYGAHLSDVFLRTESTSARIVAIILIIAMSATTFFTQKQLTQKNMPKAALEGPMASQQKVLLYVLPVIFLISGVNFPIGVLIYWTTTNLWSMGQQYYAIRRMPAPGSQAEDLAKERAEKKRRRKLFGANEPEPEVEEAPPVIEEPKRGQRQQPKKQQRSKRKKK